MLKTEQGPVRLKPTKLYQEIVVSESERKNQKLKLQKNWLAQYKKDPNMYRKAVTQAMSIAACDVQLEDLKNPKYFTTEEQEVMRSKANVAESQRTLEVKKEGMLNGNAHVAVTRFGPTAHVEAGPTHLTKHMLKKRSKKTSMMKTRYFFIEQGKLMVFHHNRENCKAKILKLEDARAVLEDKNTRKRDGASEDFASGFQFRIKLEVAERTHGPMYLYTDDYTQCKIWERAIRISSFMKQASDRDTLRTVVNLMRGVMQRKGWEALFTYARKLLDIQKTIQQFSRKLMAGGKWLPGWNKMIHEYGKQKEAEEQRLESMAKGMMHMRRMLDSIQTGSVQTKKPAEVRRGVVDSIHSHFRHYKNSQVHDRLYPLGSKTNTRIQQAKNGLKMDACFRSTELETILRLTLYDMQDFSNNPTVFQCRQAAYSEVSTDCIPVHVNVSDSLSMLSFAQRMHDEGMTNLTRADWANFVNLDQISSVVLHSERIFDIPVAPKKNLVIRSESASGPWMTIYGPRICWGRRLNEHVDFETAEKTHNVLGSNWEDSYAFAKALATGGATKWFTVAVSVTALNFPKTQEKDPNDFLEKLKGSKNDKDGPAEEMYMVVHILGHRFLSPKMAVNAAAVEGRFEAEVPVPSHTALSCLDDSEISLEFIEIFSSGARRTVWAGKTELWKVFAEEEAYELQDRVKHLMKSGGGEKRQNVVTLTKSIPSSGAATAEKNINMVHPQPPKDDRREAVSLLSSPRSYLVGKDQVGAVTLSVTTSLQDAPTKQWTTTGGASRSGGRVSTRVPISPELQGCGPVNALYSSQRGAWWDPVLKSNRFLAEHVANFVEVTVNRLQFEEDGDTGRLYKYYVEVNCNGVGVCSAQFFRPRKTWESVRPVSSKSMDFCKSKIFVPIPPGAWSHDVHESRPSLTLNVFRIPVIEDPKTLTFRELTRNGARNAGALPEKVGHATIFMGQFMHVDQAKENVQIDTGDPGTAVPEKPAPRYHLDNMTEFPDVDGHKISVQMDVVLRDGAFARLAGAKPCHYFCVGDKAILPLEEQIMYPADQKEMKERNFPSDLKFEAGKTGKWTAPLRPPSMAHEVSTKSDKQGEKLTIKFIPKTCVDVIPCRFILPDSEAEFVKHAKPGVYWRLVDAFAAKQGKSESRDAASTQLNVIRNYPKFEVTELSHLMRKAPVSVLAVYADGTCDVELDARFVQEWKDREKSLAIPGNAIINEFKDDSVASVGDGDTSELRRMRIVLEGVLLSSLQAVSFAGFNIYDAAFQSVEDAIKNDPRASNARNVFNPRRSSARSAADDRVFLGPPDKRRGGYAISAGPVPVDVGHCCQYEWALHLRADDRDDMYQFVTTLRQATRMDHFQKVVKISATEKQAAKAQRDIAYHLGNANTHSATSGTLEVVLVEARRLRRGHLTPHVASVREGIDENLFGAVNAFVTCKFMKCTNDDGQPQAKDLPYKGNLVQTSPIIKSNNNPDWSALDDYQTTGGFLFKSPTLDPESGNGVICCRLQVKTGNNALIGFRDIFVNGTPGDETESLVDPSKPFKNLWYNLEIYDADKKPTTKGAVGQIHIMTRWVPNHKSEMHGKVQPKSARGWLMKELKQKLTQEIPREPAGALQTQKRAYNPNLFRGKDEFPLTRAGVMAQHAEGLYQAEAYNDCIEDGQKEAWDDHFEGDPHAAEEPPPFDIVQALAGVDGFKFDELLRRGIFPTYRLGGDDTDRAIWFDTSMGRSLADNFGSMPRAADGMKKHDEENAVKFYRDLIEEGRTYRSEQMLQIQEDTIEASTWESTKNQLLDMHLRRVLRAQRVCIALVTYALKLKKGVIVTYSRQLLMIAFFMMIRQSKSGDRGNNSNNSNNNNNASSALRPKTPQAEWDEARHEATVFFIILALIVLNKDVAPLRSYYGAITKDGAWKPESMPKPPRAFAQELVLKTSRNFDNDLQHKINQVNHDWGMRSEEAVHDPDEPMVDGKGAMQDCYRLNCMLVTYHPDAWIHLNSLGFHMSSVFHAAFMQLFAFHLPTSSLFRFWDHLFAAPVRPRVPGSFKPANHALLDLAWAVIVKSVDDLKECDSASEARDRLLKELEFMYDQSLMMEMICDAERQLWTGILQEKVRVPPAHVKDYDLGLARYVAWQNAVYGYRHQNWIIHKIITKMRLGEAVSQASQVQDSRKKNDSRLVTMHVSDKVIKVLRNELVGDRADPDFGGIFRPTSERICLDGPEVSNGLQGKLDGMLTTGKDLVHHFGFWNKILGQVAPPVQVLRLPLPPGCPRSSGEDPNADKLKWEETVMLKFGSNWQTQVNDKTFEAFRVLSDDKFFSLNEFGLSLLIASKGTVGEKACCIFNIYGYQSPRVDMYHMNAVGLHARAVLDSAATSGEKEEAQISKPPEEDDVSKTTVLHFKIYVYEAGHDDVLKGEVYIPSLAPYLWTGMGKFALTYFDIWGHRLSRPGAGATDNAKGTRPVVGQMEMGIKWTPNADKPNMGQLGVHIQSIVFNRQVAAHEQTNPKITLITYDQNLAERKLPRWDPRKKYQKALGVVSAGQAYQGAYNDSMEWEKTMRRDPIGYLHKAHMTGGDNMGLFKKGNSSCEWRWNQQYGLQFSTPNFEFRKELFNTSSAKPNAISLQACRMITTRLLAQSLFPVTNRQALLISDAAFNRAGAVAAILDAIIVQTSVADKYKSIALLKAEKEGQQFESCKHQILLEWELQVNRNKGCLDLWPEGVEHGDVSLSSLKIANTWTTSGKTLWIRYARAGDNERGQVRIPVESDGTIRNPPSVPLDYPGTRTGDLGFMAKMSLSKEEFVACCLRSPLLSEALSKPTMGYNNSEDLPKGVPIRLEVSIGNSTEASADDDMMDLWQVRQSILLEVWDHDKLSQDDFLGEAWLTPLSDLSENPRDIILEIRDPIHKTRKSRNKKVVDKQPATGTLHVSAAWKLPSEPEDAAASSERKDRAELIKKKHTGELYLKIIKAEHLKAGDATYSKRTKNSKVDGYVCAYVHNDAFNEDYDEGWLKKDKAGFNEYHFCTKVKTDTIPVWEEEHRLELMTGAFEKKIHQKRKLMPNLHKARDQDIRILEDDVDVTINFGDSSFYETAIHENRDPAKREKGEKKGVNHGVQIFLGDTINTFKFKLQEALTAQTDYLNSVTANKEEARMEGKKYQSANITPKHQVLVFQPSQKLKELYEAEAALKRNPDARTQQPAQTLNKLKTRGYGEFYWEERKDPSRWMPLDQVRTFGNYPQLFKQYATGDSKAQAQFIKVVLGSEDYKLKNPRFRHFEEEQKKLFTKIESTNTNEHCYGYAKYEHKDDGGSTEWRPVLIERPETGAEGLDVQYKVDYLYAPVTSSIESSSRSGPSDDDSGTAAVQGTTVSIKEESVLPAFAAPNILGSASAEHQTYLVEAVEMSMNGLTDREIAEKLTKKMRDKWEREKGAESTPAPPVPITARAVQAYLKNHQPTESHEPRH